MARIFILLLLYIQFVNSVLAATTNVDLSGPGCDQLDGYYLKNAEDMVALYAYPQYNTIATRDHCDVTVRADLGRRIQYIIELINFNECGVEIRMYDNPTADTNPIHVITCSDNSKVPIQGKTKFNVFRLRVRKTTPESRAFSFTMRMKNDLGPTIDFENAAASYTGQDLEPGIIAGIAIAGGVFVVAVVLVAIYLCVRARGRNTSPKSQDYAKDDLSTVITSEKFSHHSSGTRKEYLPSPKPVQKQRPDQWRTPDDRPPRRMRPPVPPPTQPAPRDPGRKGLSDRHRSGEHASRSSSQTRNTNRRTREESVA